MTLLAKPSLLGCLFILLLPLTSARAQQAQPLTLHECINYALTHQTQIKSVRIDSAITDAQNRQITGSALPQISGTGNFTDNVVVQKQLIDISELEPPGTVPKGTLEPFEFGLPYNLQGAVTLTQALFDGTVLVALQAKRTVQDLAIKNIRETQRDVKVNVAKAYYNVLVTREELALVNDNLTALQQSLHETEEMYKNGFAEKLDEDRINVQLTNLQTQQISLVNSLELGDQLLKFQMGMPISTPIFLTDTLTFDDVSADLSDTVGFQYNQRIEYSILQTEKQEYQYNLKRYKMAYLPTLNLTAGIGANRGSVYFDYLSPGQFWYGYGYFGLNLNVPIFSGGERKSQVEQARLNVDKAEIGLEALQQSIDLEQQQAISSLRNDLLAISDQQANLKLAQEVFSKTQEKFRDGVGSNLEVVDAENELKTAQTDYFNALYNAMIAKIDYARAFGKIQ